MKTSGLTHSGNLLLAGFGAMILMISLLVYGSMKQDIQMVSKNYYEQELVYQQKLDAMHNTGPYDAAFSVTVSEGMITLRIPPALSKEISSGTVYFYYPANENMDRHENLQAGQSGIYRFREDVPPVKGYILKISFRSGNKDYYKEIKLV